MVVGITRSFNEADIIESSIRRMLAQVDHVIVGDNSSDGTEEFLRDLAASDDRVTLHWDDLPNFQQRDVMNAYAQEARGMGATWVVPFDIDEVWFADGGRIADVLKTLEHGILLAPARLLNHTATTVDDESDPDVLHRMGWREVEMLPLPKVACRCLSDLEIDHGNHSARFRETLHPPAVNGLLEARHFPYRSPEQFAKRVKACWPQLRDSGLPESHGAHMWAYGRHYDEFGDEGLYRWFRNGMLFDDPANRDHLVHDPVPALDD